MQRRGGVVLVPLKHPNPEANGPREIFKVVERVEGRTDGLGRDGDYFDITEEFFKINGISKCSDCNEYLKYDKKTDTMFFDYSGTPGGYHARIYLPHYIEVIT